METRSKRFEKAPSIRKLFPPKNHDRSSGYDTDTCSVKLANHQFTMSKAQIQQCYSSKPLLLADSRNSTGIPSQTTESAVSIYVRVDPRTTSVIPPVQIDDHLDEDNVNSPEAASSSFPSSVIPPVQVDNHLDEDNINSPEAAPSSFPSFDDKTPMNLHLYLPLYRAALKGDWEMATEFLNSRPGTEQARITRGWDTALHIAAGARHTKFVEELVKRMRTKDLAIQNKDNNTALCFAAASGITSIAQLMVERNRSLPGIRGSEGVTPLYIAALLGQREMVWYLYSVTNPEDLKLEDYFSLLVAALSSDLYDFALEILHHQPQLATYHGHNGETALHVLARKPSSFASGTQLGIWERCIYPWIQVSDFRCQFNTTQSQAPSMFQGGLFLMRACHAVTFFVPGYKTVWKKKTLNMQALKLVRCLWEQVMSLDESQLGDLTRSPLSRPLFTAAEFGIPEIVVELLCSYPDLLWKVDAQNRSLFHIAVIHRRNKIFNLIYDIGAHKDLITSYRDNNNHNIFHLAAKLAPLNQLTVVSGAALQMQKELLWFKVINDYCTIEDYTSRHLMSHMSIPFLVPSSEVQLAQHCT